MADNCGMRTASIRNVLVLACLASMLDPCPPRAHAGSLQEAADQAVSILNRFSAIPEGAIPHEVLVDAEGLAILHVVKAGFLFSGRGGQGIVVARINAGWSGPVGVTVGGIGFGFQAGVQMTELILVLNTRAAVNAFAGGGTVSLGGDLSAAVGPIGRAASAGITPRAAVYSYCINQGLFAGISVEGTVLLAEPRRNAEYYGTRVNPADILAGRVVPPPGARRLLLTLEKLDSAYGIKPSNLLELVSPVQP